LYSAATRSPSWWCFPSQSLFSHKPSFIKSSVSFILNKPLSFVVSLSEAPLESSKNFLLYEMEMLTPSPTIFLFLGLEPIRYQQLRAKWIWFVIWPLLMCVFFKYLIRKSLRIFPHKSRALLSPGLLKLKFS
jgi:hypothetical protein